MVTRLKIVVSIVNKLVADGNIVATRDDNLVTIGNELEISGIREKAIRHG